MTSRAWRLLLVLLLLAGLGVAIAIISRSSSQAPNSKNVEASFQGSTNMDRRSFGKFTLTNPARGEVAFLVEAFEYFESNAWTRVALKGPNRGWLNEWKGERKNTLKPRESYSFLAPAPVTNASWRIVIRCFERNALRDRPRELLIQFTNSAARGDRMFSGRNYQVVMPPVPE